jgi:hypothetical protein
MDLFLAAAYRAAVKATALAHLGNTARESGIRELVYGLQNCSIDLDCIRRASLNPATASRIA